MLDLNDLRKNPPGDCNDVIIGCVCDDRFQWYVSDPGQWRLLGEEFDDAHEFLKLVHRERTTTQTLQSYLAEFAERFDAAEESEIQDIFRQVFPAFYFGCDRCLAIVFDDEVFGAYFIVPNDWTYKVQPLLSVIPARERFWLIDGTDLFQRYLFDWSQAECTFDSSELRRESDNFRTDVASEYRKRRRPWWRLW